MNSYDTATPRLATYVILRKGNLVAFVLRENVSWMKHHYGMPSGKVEKNEAFTAAAIREAKEETGVDILPEDLEYIHTMHRNEGTDWVDVYFEAKKWSGTPYNAEPHMHSSLEWLDPGNLPKNVIPSVAYALKQIADGKTFSEFGW